jgi:hypothetical protein
MKIGGCGKSKRQLNNDPPNEDSLGGLTVYDLLWKAGNSVAIPGSTSSSNSFNGLQNDALSAEEEYQRHREVLPKQFHPLSITDLKDTICASLPAYEYTFEWSEGTRTVILIKRENATYRILINPRSLVNLQILSTVEWLDLT